MKPSKWVEDYNSKTLKPDPFFDLYEPFLGTQEEAIFFIHERMKLKKTDENKPYFGYLKALTDVIQSTMSFLSEDNVIVDNTFQTEVGNFLSFMICEKRFAINTYLASYQKVVFKEENLKRVFATAAKKSFSKFNPAQIRIAVISSIIRIIKFFTYLHTKLLDFANKKRLLRDRTVTISSMGKRSPVSYKMLKLLLNSLTRTLKRTLSGLRSKHKDRQEFRYLMNLNSCLSLFLDSQTRDMAPLLRNLPTDLSFQGTGTAIDSLVSTTAHTVTKSTVNNMTPKRRVLTPNLSSHDSNELTVSEFSSNELDNSRYPGETNAQFMDMVKNMSKMNSAMRGKDRELEKAKRRAITSKLRKRRLEDSDDDMDEDMMRFVFDADKIEEVAKEFQKKEIKIKTPKKIDVSISSSEVIEFETERGYRPKSSNINSLLELEQISENEDEKFSSESEEELNDDFTIFSKNFWDLQTRMDLLKELEPIKREHRIPDHHLYEAFNPMITPIKEPKEEEDITYNDIATDFELIMKKKKMKKKKSPSITGERGVVDLTSSLSKNVNFTLDTHQKFKEDFLAHLKSKERKLIELKKSNQERDERERLEEEKMKMEKEKRRGGWARRQKIMLDRKEKLPPAFASKRIDLRKEINVKAQDFHFFDPDKVPEEIENIEIEETYENCIPDEKLFEDDVDFVEDDIWGFQKSTFFNEIDGMLEMEHLNHQDEYSDNYNFDMMRLTDLSTQLSSSDEQFHPSSVIPDFEFFSTVSMKRMAKNRIQLERARRLKETSQWCITSQLIPRSYTSKSLVFIHQKSRKGYKEMNKVY